MDWNTKGWDPAKAAGVLAIGALLVLVTLRRSFAGVNIGLGD